MRPVQPNIPQEPTLLSEFLRQYINDLYNVLHNISFGNGTNSSEAQNTDTRILDGTTDAIAGTEKAFDHILGRVPVGFINCGQDKAGSIYKGGTAWTTTKVYLKSDAASLTFKAILF